MALAIPLLSILQSDWLLLADRYYGVAKLHLRRTPLLLSHTLTTAVQEVVCLVLAQSIIARTRVTAAGEEHPPLQISFIQTLHLCRSFWMITASAFSDLLPPELVPLLFQRVLDLLRQQASPPQDIVRARAPFANRSAAGHDFARIRHLLARSNSGSRAASRELPNGIGSNQHLISRAEFTGDCVLIVASRSPSRKKLPQNGALLRCVYVFCARGSAREAFHAQATTNPAIFGMRLRKSKARIYQQVMEKMDRVKRPLFRNGSAAGSGSDGIENERGARLERTRSSTRTSRLRSSRHGASLPPGWPSRHARAAGWCGASRLSPAEWGASAWSGCKACAEGADYRPPRGDNAADGPRSRAPGRPETRRRRSHPATSPWLYRPGV
jgi:hypothetical protein